MPKEQEIEAFLSNQIDSRLLLFSNVENEVQIKKDEIIVCCWSESKGMRIEANVAHSRTEPERFIRNIRKLEKIGEKVEEVVKDTHQE